MNRVSNPGVANPSIQPKCAECEAEKKENKLQRKEEEKEPEEFVEEEPQIQENPIFESEAVEENIQTKSADGLTVGQPDDKYEQEADAMADQVVQKLSEPELEVKDEDEKPELQTKPEVQETSMSESDNPETAIEAKPTAESVLYTSNSPGQTIDTAPLSTTIATIQPKCEACEKEEQDEEPDEQPELQKKEGTSVSQPSGNDSLESKLSAKAGKGSSLDDTTRNQMESGFGVDFSKVNIHTDSQAVEMNKSLGAQAFTHGSDIYFNEGKYDPETTSGKHLLAHELTHTVQQGASGNIRAKSDGSDSNVPDVQCLLPVAGPVVWWGAGYVASRIVRWGIDKLRENPEEAISMAAVLRKVILSIPVDIKGMPYFNPPSVIAEHIKAYALIAEVLREIGGIFGFTDNDINDYAKGPEINLQYGNLGGMNNVRVSWDRKTKTYQMAPYQMGLSHPLFDFSESLNVLGMEVRIKNGKISGTVGVANALQLIKHITTTKWKDSPSSFQFNFELMEKAILGEEAADAYPIISYGILNNGYIDLMYSGLVDIGNFHLIEAFLHLNDVEDKAEWKGELDLNVMGMQPFTLDIDRTPKGLISGVNDEKKILLDKSFAKKGADKEDKKGFEFTTNVTASYLNKVLTIQGEANYSSSRAQGSLFLMVTDYSTAKKHAIQFLPREIISKAEADEPPPNPSERLAFMGAGNLSFTLFDGNKETRKLKLGKQRNLIGEEPGEQPNLALRADASFVVEPEGYITIAGQVKPKEEKFDLFDEKEYKAEPLKLLDITIAKIPGPLGTSVDFDFEVKLEYGASIGPLTLSELKAEGFYSNRPGSFSELELSGLIKLLGKMFVNLKFCIEVEGSILGVFEIDLVEFCIEAGVGIAGAIQARPTIQMVLPTEASINTPPEYFIQGNFHFDAGGKLFLQIGDSLKINLTKKKDTEKDTDTPSNWKYKNSKEVAKKEFGGRDVEIPMDHTLGSKEIPRVSFRKFAKENLKRFLTKLITSDRPRKPENVDKYFEPGVAEADGSESEESKEDFGTGGFEEGREEKGELEEKEVLEDDTTTEDNEANYVFSEGFTMWGAFHELHLIVNQINSEDKPTVYTKIMMESELEELSEKIEEENKEIGTSSDPQTDLQKADLARIEDQADRIKEDAKKLGVNNEIYNKPKFPGLKETTISIQNYGNRYKKSDLGIEDETAEPDCDKPKDVHPGDEIFFPNYTEGENIGFVIEVVAYPTKDKKQSFWYIRFKPKSGREKTSFAPRAFDKDCKPTYILPKANKECKKTSINPVDKAVPGRVVNKVHIPKDRKAGSVKAYPLCWGENLDAKDNLVGMDRISEKERKKWHRAHLVHAKMGGKGAYWNLVPVPQLVNNSKMRTQYESKLIKLVSDGYKNGKQYWFKAEVIYHQNSDNPVVGHYDDFVKEIKIYYGEAVDLGDGKWEFKDDGKLKTTISIGNLPSSNDLKPDRVKG